MTGQTKGVRTRIGSSTGEHTPDIVAEIRLDLPGVRGGVGVMRDYPWLFKKNALALSAITNNELASKKMQEMTEKRHNYSAHTLLGRLNRCIP